MGGRGVRSLSDRNKQNFQGDLGTVVARTLNEAIGIKGKPDSIAQAAKNANPLFSQKYSEYSENCQRAVVAYELRRRGYKVYSQPTFKNDALPYIAHHDYKSGAITAHWAGAFKNAKFESVGAANRKKLIANIDKKMKSYGNGSRAVLQVQWKSGGGHVFNVERVNGKNVYIDAQSNRRYTSEYIGRTIKPGSVNIIRTDNLRISERAKKSVTTRKY